MRIGIGYDVHRLVADRALIIGGVKVEYSLGLLGHSDADVLTHALMDALLGAVGEGDIGRHFPDTDMQYAGVSSLILLDRVMQLVWQKGYKIGNVDCIVVAEQPKLSPYIADIRRRLAQALAAEDEQVNVKATTSEGLGFTGSGEGIAAHAVVVLTKKS